MNEWSIQPFSKSHDRSEFDCGVEPLNLYLQRQASQDVKRRVCALYVACDTESGGVIGYYTISAATARLARLPGEMARKLPRYPEVPAFLIGRLAVALSTQGKGLGRVLLVDALLRCLELSDEVGAALALVDVKDSRGADFYRKFQFEPLDGNRMFLPLSVVASLGK